MAAALSGGGKRKLCVAVALVGNPAVVLLDEPSAGLDPVARRKLWDVVAETAGTRAVVLTTHLMDECEALCDRLAIMVKGKLRCLGTAQRLKTKFGGNYDLRVVLAPKADAKAVDAFFAESLRAGPPTQVMGRTRFYKLARPSSGLAAVFRKVDEAKAGLGVDECAVTQPTLENVFLDISAKYDRAAAPAADA